MGTKTDRTKTTASDCTSSSVSHRLLGITSPRVRLCSVDANLKTGFHGSASPVGSDQDSSGQIRTHHRHVNAITGTDIQESHRKMKIFTSIAGHHVRPLKEAAAPKTLGSDRNSPTRCRLTLVRALAGAATAALLVLNAAATARFLSSCFSCRCCCLRCWHQWLRF